MGGARSQMIELISVAYCRSFRT